MFPLAKLKSTIQWLERRRGTPAALSAQLMSDLELGSACWRPDIAAYAAQLSAVISEAGKLWHPLVLHSVRIVRLPCIQTLSVYCQPSRFVA